MQKGKTDNQNFDLAEEAAARWLAKLDRDLTDQEEAEFMAWLEEAPEHAEALQKLQKVWSYCDRMAQSEAILNAPPSDTFALFNKPWIWTAAAMLLITISGFFTWQTITGSTEAPTPLANSAFATTYERHVLEDGSVVEMDVGSQVMVNYTEKERNLDLISGQAHFIVEKNKQRPFVVNVSGVSVLAVGTAFSVSLNDGFMEVLVTEGKVKLKEESKDTSIETPAESGEKPALHQRLVAGQRTILNLREKQTNPEIIEASTQEIVRKLSWRDEIIEFASTPLIEVVEQLNKRNFEQIIILNKDLNTLKINATIKPNNLHGFLEMLHFSAGINYEKSDAGKILLRKADQ